MAEGKGVCRILSLDGGGAKGFYALGILHEIAALLPRPFHETFDLIYGTSTGSIIAALLALGKPVDEIHELYKKHVPAIMKAKCRSERSRKLHSVSLDVFQSTSFEEMKTGVGIVATNWKLEKPMIFKNKARSAHGRGATFVPGFGCTIAEAVEASCSAYPYFSRKIVTSSDGTAVELVDGGFSANNPTLYALADATVALGHQLEDCRVLSLGCGQFPESPKNIIQHTMKKIWPVTLLEKTLEVNARSMDQLRAFLFEKVPTVRISETFSESQLATNFLEHDKEKLDLLWQQGRESFGRFESSFRTTFLGGE